MVIIRKEEPSDIPAIHEINAAAFEQPLEAEIVDILRENCPNLISLVAEIDGLIAGHILFSPAIIDSGEKQLLGMGLAPMAVAPDYQTQGIGSKLVLAGLQEIEDLGFPFVIVLGHPEYYPRFGFVKASECNIKSEYEGVPDEAFMIRIFDKAELAGVSGIAKYRPEFNDAV